jgi:hypothetical protein
MPYPFLQSTDGFCTCSIDGEQWVASSRQVQCMCARAARTRGGTSQGWLTRRASRERGEAGRQEWASHARLGQELKGGTPAEGRPWYPPRQDCPLTRCKCQSGPAKWHTRTCCPQLLRSALVSCDSDDEALFASFLLSRSSSTSHPFVCPRPAPAGLWPLLSLGMVNMDLLFLLLMASCDVENIDELPFSHAASDWLTTGSPWFASHGKIWLATYQRFQRGLENCIDEDCTGIVMSASATCCSPRLTLQYTAALTRPTNQSANSPATVTGFSAYCLLITLDVLHGSLRWKSCDDAFPGWQSARLSKFRMCVRHTWTCHLLLPGHHSLGHIPVSAACLPSPAPTSHMQTGHILLPCNHFEMHS